jgi:hypothetical protein
MTENKILKVMTIYETKLDSMLHKEAWMDHAQLMHARDMCTTIREFVQNRKTDKAFRWLGFVQGVLWCTGVYTIAEMKDHNRLTKEEVREEYIGHSLFRLSPCSACGDLDGCHKWRTLEEASAV